MRRRMRGAGQVRLIKKPRTNFFTKMIQLDPIKKEVDKENKLQSNYGYKKKQSIPNGFSNKNNKIKNKAKKRN